MIRHLVVQEFKYQSLLKVSTPFVWKKRFTLIFFTQQVFCFKSSYPGFLHHLLERSEGLGQVLLNTHENGA